jgi:hypothetical protein
MVCGGKGTEGSYGYPKPETIGADRLAKLAGAIVAATEGADVRACQWIAR